VFNGKSDSGDGPLCKTTLEIKENEINNRQISITENNSQSTLMEEDFTVNIDVTNFNI
jgi:hypothetical protein